MLTGTKAKKHRKSRKFKKKQATEKSDYVVSSPQENSPAAAIIGTDSTINDDEIHGLELREYSRKFNLETSEVWKKIRRGELVARTENGFIYVYGHSVPDHSLSDFTNETGQLQKSPTDANNVFPRGDLDELPPLPMEINTDASETRYLEDSSSPTVALLLDHLALAKEENRKVLAFTQDAIIRITKMSDTIVDMKDSLINEKEKLLKVQEQKINSLNSQLNLEKNNNLNLHQNIEDLEMLAESLIKEKS